MRRYIIASHHLLAHGLKDTLNFLTSMDGIIDISAYMDDTDLPTQIKVSYIRVLRSMAVLQIPGITAIWALS